MLAQTHAAGHGTYNSRYSGKTATKCTACPDDYHMSSNTDDLPLGDPDYKGCTKMSATLDLSTLKVHEVCHSVLKHEWMQAYTPPPVESLLSHRGLRNKIVLASVLAHAFYPIGT